MGHLAGPVQEHLGQKPEVTGTPIGKWVPAAIKLVAVLLVYKILEAKLQHAGVRRQKVKRLSTLGLGKLASGPCGTMRRELRQVQGQRPTGELGG